MSKVLIIIQIILSLSLIAAILLQAQGTGLGGIFGAGGETYRSRRGIEKILFWATIILSACFLLVSVLNIFAQ